MGRCSLRGGRCTHGRGWSGRCLHGQGGARCRCLLGMGWRARREGAVTRCGVALSRTTVGRGRRLGKGGAFVAASLGRWALARWRGLRGLGGASPQGDAASRGRVGASMGYAASWGRVARLVAASWGRVARACMAVGRCCRLRKGGARETQPPWTAWRTHGTAASVGRVARVYAASWGRVAHAWGRSLLGQGGACLRSLLGQGGARMRGRVRAGMGLQPPGAGWRG